MHRFITVICKHLQSFHWMHKGYQCLTILNQSIVCLVRQEKQLQGIWLHLHSSDQGGTVHAGLLLQPAQDGEIL